MRDRPSPQRRRARAGLVASVAVVGLLALGCNQGAEVETLSPRVGRIVESFTEPARTRLEKTYLITLPVAGRISRIDFEPGDEITQGQALVTFDATPLEKTVEEAAAVVAELEAELEVKDHDELEQLAGKEADASVLASLEALNAADEQVKAEQARHKRAKTDLERKTILFKSERISPSEFDDVQLAAETALIELRKQEFYRAALKALIIAIKLGPPAVKEYLAKKRLERVVIDRKLEQAKARLASSRHDLALVKGQRSALRSPIKGVVLERYEQGDSTLPAGTRLLLLGSLDQLEVEADVLTQDALRLPKDGKVVLQPAAGRELLSGKVKRIEPAGFTKLSSLGVEQQRVRVIVSLDERPKGLGVGYRLQARFITGAKDDALIVPRFSVLQAPDRSFYAFKIADGRLKKQTVEIGLRSDLELEVTDGLDPDDAIVAHPDTTLKDGAKAKVTGTGEHPATDDEAHEGGGEPPG